MMMLSSEEPWSIILTLTLLCARAAKILPAVPRVDFMRPGKPVDAGRHLLLLVHEFVLMDKYRHGVDA